MIKNSGVWFAALFVIVVGSLGAQDWTQWRGPNRDGVAPFTEPKTWPEKLTTKWKVTIGEGYASPLFADGRILEFARQGDDEVAMGVDPGSGKILWRQSYPAPYTPVDAAMRHGKGPKSTPLIYQGRLYTFGSSGVLSSFDAATGKLEWRKEYTKDFKATWPMFGTSMSPVAADGVVVVLVGTNDDGAVIAYDAKSGAQKWIWKGDGPAYASPVIVEIDGVKQVVTLTQKYALGLSIWRAVVENRLSGAKRHEYTYPAPLRPAADSGRRSGNHVAAGEQTEQLLDGGEGLGDFGADHAFQLAGAEGESDFRILQPAKRSFLLRRRGHRENTLDQSPAAGRQRRCSHFGRPAFPVEG
jgi:hypothetical protein